MYASIHDLFASLFCNKVIGTMQDGGDVFQAFSFTSRINSLKDAVCSALLWPPKARPLYFTAVIYLYFLFCHY